MNIKEIRKRYFRLNNENPKGDITHRFDCDIYKEQICTCGLLRDLLLLDKEDVEKIYPKFEEEYSKHDFTLTRVFYMLKDDK